jgi:ATP-dependent Clp protease ATP-binding subunit ClpA
MYLSYEAHQALLEAERIAIKHGQTHIGAEDLILAILKKPKSDIRTILERLGNVELVIKKASARKGKPLKTSLRVPLGNPKVAHRFRGVLERSKSEVSNSGRTMVEVEDFIMAILKNGDGIGADALLTSKITVVDFKTELQKRPPKPRQPVLLEKPIWDF